MARLICAFNLCRHTDEAMIELLLLPALACRPVAAVAGFSDPAYFSRIFKAQFGQTPARFRSLSVAGPARPKPAGRRRSVELVMVPDSLGI